MKNYNISMNEFNAQYNRIMSQLTPALSGGSRPKKSRKAESSESSDSDVSVDDASKSITVSCINITQQKGDLKFEGKTCKSPGPISLRFKQDSVKLANVVKSLLHFVNRGLRMADVDSVEIVKGKKSTTHKGDELGGDVNLDDFVGVKEVNITMH